MVFTSEGKRKIVIVESWALMRKFMEDTVRKMNECQLVKMFSNDKTIEEYIDNNEVSLLIADITSDNEERMLSVIRRIKNKRPDLKVILTTLTFSAKLEEMVKEAGTDGLWQKEISEQSFENICRSVI